MDRKKGFTLVEVLLVIVILGILSATAIPFVRVWQQRAYGSEATIMMKQLMDGQITYYLDNDRFFPEVDSDAIIIEPKAPPSADLTNLLNEVKQALNVAIPAGHNLEYFIENHGPLCRLEIRAAFPLFNNGHKALIGEVYSEGQTHVYTLIN